MIEVARALHKFYKSFGIPAYEEHSVPDNAALPYITYELVNPDWRDDAVITANVWYSGTSFTPLFNKVDEIGRAIGEGLRIPTESGCVYLTKGNPFSQVSDTGNDEVKVCYLMIGMQAVCK